MHMKCCHIRLFWLLLFSNLLLCQEWQKIEPVFNPAGSYNCSYGVFTDSRKGWIVEYFPGRIWQTSDSGESWYQQVDSSNSWIHDIFFLDSLNGWALKERTDTREHSILYTYTGGKLWKETDSPEVYCIKMLSNSTGFAGGDSIFKTTDSCKTWHSKPVIPSISCSISDFFFINNKNGWAVGYSNYVTDMGIILKTTDGGETWQVNNHPASASAQAVFFVDSLQGYVVGSNPPFFNGVIMTTFDGGIEWNTQYYDDCMWFYDINFINPGTGYVIGNNGYMRSTSDSGQTWSMINLNINTDLKRIAFVDSGQTGYILGKNNTILRYGSNVADISIKPANTPKTYFLDQNYPNPFNSSCVISYTVAKPSLILLKIYDISGKEIKTLVKKNQKPGKYSITYNAENLSSGIYYYQLQGRNLLKYSPKQHKGQAGQSFSETKKMLLVK